MAATVSEQVAALRRQKAAIAEFGGQAVRTDDLDALLNEAAVLVARGLGVESAKVLTPERDGSLLVRAGCGWAPDVVGHARLEADSPAGYALKTGEPVVSSDTAKERRFRISEVLIRHGIKSMVNVIIRGAGEPFGVLEVDHRQVREFSEDDVNFLQGYANLLAAAVDRLEKDHAIRRAMEQNELLLRELRHRVNNNLQQIVALINIQRSRASPEARADLATIADRLNSLRLLYRRLFVRGEQIDVRLDDYVADIARSLIEAQSAAGVQVSVDIPEMVVDIDVAVALGLMINEFITNSLKHAFPSGQGRIAILLERDSQGSAKLTLNDNGVGLPDSAAQEGLGLSIIARLADQLRADPEWRRGDGTTFICRFSLDPVAASCSADRVPAATPQS
jgi:two-component sensor histidine kinase